ncbi:MAG: response regulator [Kofleriaceae bacterium]
MRVTASAGERHVLVLHDDPNVADQLSRLFEQAGFDVVTALTGFRAEAYLGGHRTIDVVVTSWGVGGELYRWALQRRYDLRDRFVFVGTDLPREFDEIVAGRCLAVAVDQPTDLVQVATAVVERKRQLEASRKPTDSEAPKRRLLLADDDPILLAEIGNLLAEQGYAVTRVDSGREAIKVLEDLDVSAIVCDWHMDDFSGADVYRWIVAERPWLAEHVVFLSDRDGDAPDGIASSRPMFRKGQDARALADVLREIVWHSRLAAS